MSWPFLLFRWVLKLRYIFGITLLSCHKCGINITTQLGRHESEVSQLPHGDIYTGGLGALHLQDPKQMFVVARVRMDPEGESGCHF